MELGRFRPNARRLLLFSLFCLPSAQPMGGFPDSAALPSTPEIWSGDGPSQDALGFKIERARGVVLSIEAKNATHDRLQANAKTPFRFNDDSDSGGRVLGEYRTEGLSLYGALVTARFLRLGQVVGRRDLYLVPSATWRNFDIPVRFLPLGTDAVDLSVGLESGAVGSLLANKLEFARPARRLVGCGAYQAFARTSAPDGLANAVPMTRIMATSWGTWLVSSKGRAFFSLGLGSAATPAPSQLVSLGFNSKSDAPGSAYWTGLAQADPGRAVRAFLALESSSVILDPFDRSSTTSYRAYLAKTVGPGVGVPSIVGTFTDGHYDFSTIGQRMWTDASRPEMLRALRGQFTSIDLLNRAWKTNYSSFEDVAASRPDLAHASGAMADGLRLLARTYFSRYLLLTTQLLRATDPTHLVFSPTIDLGPGFQAAEPFLDLFASFDAISVSLHPSSSSAGLDENETQALNLISTRTGRPLLVMGLEAPVNVGSGPSLLEQTDQILIGLYNLPFVVGVHWADLPPTIELAVRAFNGRIWTPDPLQPLPVAAVPTAPSGQVSGGATTSVKPIAGLPAMKTGRLGRPVSGIQKF